MKAAFALALVMMMPAQSALAGGCSEILGLETIALPGGLVGIGGAAPTGKFDLNFDDLYSIKNPTTGKPMIGSKEPGPSGAGTKGILKDTHGTWQARWLPLLKRVRSGGVVVFGTVAFEAGCWLVDYYGNDVAKVQSAAL